MGAQSQCVVSIAMGCFHHEKKGTSSAMKWKAPGGGAVLAGRSATEDAEKPPSRQAVTKEREFSCQAKQS